MFSLAMESGRPADLDQNNNARKRSPFFSLGDLVETDVKTEPSSYEFDDPMDISRIGETEKAEPGLIDMFSRAVSQERLKLSNADRIALDEEIHGVRCRALEETPELIQRSLMGFRKELYSLSNNMRRIYDMIASRVVERRYKERLERNSNINHWNTPPSVPHHTKHYATEDDDFRLRFLRCELFDVKKAVKRFLNYLNLVHELWGFEIVSRRLVLVKDFSKLEYKYLKKGDIQLLPFRDRSGRRVIVVSNDPSDPHCKEVDNTTRLKCLFYITDIASRDLVEDQQKGAIWLTDPNAMVYEIKNRIPIIEKFHKATITRITAGHHFLPDSKFYKLFETFMLVLYRSGALTEQVVRHKCYVGYTQLGMKYHILGYGIPVQYMPWTDTGKIKSKYWNGWLKLRSVIESDRPKIKALDIVDCPGTTDVVFRHGRSYKKFHGNDILQEWIESKLLCRKLSSSASPPPSSHAESVSSSMEIGNISVDCFCDRLIDEIKNNQNGRFLKWDFSLKVWVRMTNESEIKKKISASFYNYAKRNCDTLVETHRSVDINNTNNNTNNDPCELLEGGKLTPYLCSTARTFDTNETKRKKQRSEIAFEN